MYFELINAREGSTVFGFSIEENDFCGSKFTSFQKIDILDTL